MTVYTANVLLKHHAAGDLRPRLWADDPEEAMCAAYSCGASLDDLQPATTWVNYLITPAQQRVAIEQGAVLSDWLEPAYQRAKAAGDGSFVRQIERTRRNCARRVRELQAGDVVAFVDAQAKPRQARFLAASGFEFVGDLGELGLLTSIYRINGHAAA